jgi:tetratricopeptide (TPR) repeat protein
MANVWVCALGTGHSEDRDERVPREWVRRTIHELQTSLKDEAQVSEWIPFDSEHKHREEENYVVLLVPPSDCFGVRDYFIAANALALADSGWVRVLPMILELSAADDAASGIGEAVSESARERRNRRVRDKLTRTAVCVVKTDQGDALCGELMGRLKAEMAEWPKRGSHGGRRSVSLFFSYSHSDAMLRDALARHLELLGRTGLFEAWYDHKILPGGEWASEIDRHLCTSDIVLLLLSADFFASQYCSEVEMPFAQERHIAASARVIPVVLRPVIWTGSWLHDLQALPVGALPVSAWPSADSAFVSVCEGILAAALATRADAARRKRKTPEFFTRTREVDTAMPRELQIDRSAMLIVLIRKTSSEGLRGLVAGDASYGMEPEDVHSRTASVQFRYISPEKLGSLKLMAVVRSPDFDPAEQKRIIHLPPDGDSQPVIFMVAPMRTGRLRAVVEIYDGERLLVSCPMSTLAVTAQVSETATVMGSAAFAVEDTTAQDAGGRHIDFEPDPVFSYPSFPVGTSPQMVKEFVLRQELATNEKSMSFFELAITMDSLANLLEGTGRTEEAEALYRRALASQGERLNSHRTRFLDRLAALSRATNRLSEAELLMRRSIEIKEKMWGPEQWGVGLAMYELALLLLEMRKETEAEVALRRAIAIIAKGSGPTPGQHDDLERVVRVYAEMLEARGMSRPERLAVLREALPDEFFRK